MRYLAAVLLAAACVARGAAAKEKDRAERRALFSVVMVTGVDGGTRYEVVEPGKVAAMRTEMMKAYREANSTWLKESAEFKKDPENRKKRFDKPRPTMPSVTVAKSNIRGRKAADEALAEMQALCSIVRIRGLDGKTSLEAVPNTDLNARRAKLMAEYAEALRTWERDSAGKPKGAGLVLVTPKPQSPVFTVMKKDVKDIVTAQDMISKLAGGAR